MKIYLASCFYANFITNLCRYYNLRQGYYISMQLVTFLAFITFLCPTGLSMKMLKRLDTVLITVKLYRAFLQSFRTIWAFFCVTQWTWFPLKTNKYDSVTTLIRWYPNKRKSPPLGSSSMFSYLTFNDGSIVKKGSLLPTMCVNRIPNQLFWRSFPLQYLSEICSSAFSDCFCHLWFRTRLEKSPLFSRKKALFSFNHILIFDSLNTSSSIIYSKIGRLGRLA